MRLFADIRGTQHVESFGVGSHEAVLDAVVDHFDEVAGAVRAAVQVALLGGAAGILRAPACASMSPMPGASRAKMGSRCCTVAASPPIIMQ